MDTKIQIKDFLTGELFEPKKSNQHFSCRANQIRYNNLLAKKKRLIKAPYDNPLDKNRTILKRILGNQEEVVKSRDFLEGAGYNFKYHQYQITIDKINGITAKGIYEFLIFCIDNNNYKIQNNGTAIRNK